jgi:DNA-binding transcriptional LysR family regulator
LTPSGELLLEYATRLVRIADEAEGDVKAYAISGARRLRLSYLPYYDVPGSTAIGAEFRRRHPGVVFEAGVACSSVHLSLLATGQLDAAFVAGIQAASMAIEFRRTVFDHMVAVMATSHRLARAPMVSAADAAGQELILFPPHLNPYLFNGLTSWLSSHGTGRLNIGAYEPYEQAVECVAATNSLVTLLPQDLATKSARTGVVYRTISPSPAFNVGMAFRPDDPSPTLRHLLKVVAEVVAPQGLHLPKNCEVVA